MSSSLCGCHSPVGGRVCSLVVGVEAPRSVYKLWCAVGRIGILSLGEELLVLLHRSSVVLPATSCVGSGTHCCWHCPPPLQLWECRRSAWMSCRCCVQCHQHGFVGTDLLKSGTGIAMAEAPGPAVGTTAGTPALPPRVTKPTATNQGPAPSTGAPVICSDVPQAGTELTELGGT